MHHHGSFHLGDLTNPGRPAGARGSGRSPDDQIDFSVRELGFCKNLKGELDGLLELMGYQYEWRKRSQLW